MCASKGAKARYRWQILARRLSTCCSFPFGANNEHALSAFLEVRYVPVHEFREWNMCKEMASFPEKKTNPYRIPHPISLCTSRRNGEDLVRKRRREPTPRRSPSPWMAGWSRGLPRPLPLLPAHLLCAAMSKKYFFCVTPHGPCWPPTLTHPVYVKAF